MSNQDKQREIQALQAELINGGLSRRTFLNRLKGLGIGFGAAFILNVDGSGADAKAAGVPGPVDGLSVQSSNPALSAVMEEGQEDRRSSRDPANSDQDEKKFAETYTKKYTKYSKGYDKYSKGYGKYDKYSKYDKYNKYAKYDKYTKYARYDKYAKYAKYAKYDKYTKYARYSKGLPTR